MKCGKSCSKHLPCKREMTQISSAIVFTGVALAIFIQRCAVIGMSCIADIDISGGSEEISISRISRWQNAVEHIDAAVDAFKQIFRSSHTHQITRFVVWQK